MTAMTKSTGEKRLAYIALPGLSTASLLANLPYLMYGSSHSQPVIIMDIYDYNRLQAIALKETDNSWNQNLAMAYGHLLRRGVIQLIDYSQFYPNYTQEKIIKQNQEELGNVDTDIQKETAVRAAKRREKYQRGEYQETFRENLGENLDVFIGGRKTEQSRRRKLQRECIDPYRWNKEIMNQYAAALEVRGVADETFDHLNVKYIIGEGESVIVGENGLVANASHIPAQSHIQDLPPDELATTRDIFETIGELAVEMTGVQHDDWMLIAPTLAIPQYDDIFDMVQIHNRVESGLDYERLSEEIVRVIETLERRTEDSPDPTSAAEWLAESEIMPFAVEDTQRQHLTKMTNYMMTLAQISDELRPLVWDGKVSHVAGLIGASIVSDPSPHNELDDIYRQGEEIINRFGPSSINADQLTAIRRRKQGWEETADWYDTADRER